MSYRGHAKGSYGIRKAQRIHARRSPIATHIDEHLKASIAKSFEQWQAQPNRFDLPEVDTPKKNEPKKEFYTKKYPRTQYIRHITIRGDKNNNKMERMNEEVRDREKTMRGLKIKDTPILTGYQLFHNYIRPHEALDGKTPSRGLRYPN